MSSFAIPGAYPPPSVKSDRRVVAGQDGALKTLLFEEPSANLPLLVRAMVASQDNTVWIAASPGDDTLLREESGGISRFYLRVKPGTLPPGSYRTHLWVRSPSAPEDDRPVKNVSKQFTVPDTPFTSPEHSSYRPLGNLAALLARTLKDKGILDDVVTAACREDYWSYWET